MKIDRYILDQMLERLLSMHCQPVQILSLMASVALHEPVEKAIQKIYPHESLVFQRGSCAPGWAQLVVANLCGDWLRLLPQIDQAMAESGVLVMSMLGEDSFAELLQEVDDIQCPPLASLVAVGDACMQSGFKDPVVDRQKWTLNYSSAQQLAEDLNALGVTRSAPIPGALFKKGGFDMTLELIQLHALGRGERAARSHDVTVALESITFQNKKEPG